MICLQSPHGAIGVITQSATSTQHPTHVLKPGVGPVKMKMNSPPALEKQQALNSALLMIVVFIIDIQNGLFQLPISLNFKIYFTEIFSQISVFVKYLKLN